MDTRAPIVIILLAVAILVLGYLVEVLLGKFRLRGYGHIARDVRLLAAAIHGKADRDREDVVVRGNAHSWPVSVRFSLSDQKPGLNIRMSVPFQHHAVLRPAEPKARSWPSTVALFRPVV